MRKRFHARLFFGLAILAVLFASRPAPAGDPSADRPEGKDVPAFRATDLSGRELSTEQIGGTVRSVVINFWGLRCGDCLTEIPYLNEIHKKYAGSGLQIWGVNIDGVGSEEIRKQMAGLPVAPVFPVIPDPEFRVVDSFSVMAAPLTILVSPDRKVAYYHEGFATGDEKVLEEKVKGQLGIR